MAIGISGVGTVVRHNVKITPFGTEFYYPDIRPKKNKPDLGKKQACSLKKTSLLFRNNKLVVFCSH
jgi:hypothetical protein